MQYGISHSKRKAVHLWRHSCHIISGYRIFIIPGRLPDAPYKMSAGTALGDFYQFDIATSTWTEIDGSLATGPPPSERADFGFVASGSKLFVYGGSTAGLSLIGTLLTAVLLLSLAT